jgi:4-amino-4-deoxy-L-arabinose transferase-like glycosyltransferase
MSEMITQNKSFFRPSGVFLTVLLAILFLGGLGIRLYDLTDPPLGTRPLRSAVIARGMYYQNLNSAPEWQRQVAVSQWKEEGVIEPQLLERIVAISYRLVGQEYLWLARLINTLLWVVSGIALYALAKDMGYPDGGVISLVYYLFLPFAILESRAFQPDPLMVSLIVLALWAMYRWYLRQTWGAAVLAGGLAGLAIYVKSVALFPVLGAWLGLLLAGIGLRKAFRHPAVWLISALTILPGLLYTIYGTFIAGFLAQQFSLRFFPNLLQEPAFYVRWMNQIGFKAGFGAFMLSLVGLLLLRTKEQKAMGAGLLAGYVLYGFSLPFHITTHDYYQLPLIPIVALLLAPVAETIFKQLSSLNYVSLLRVAILGILVFGLAFKLWDVRVTLAQRDDRKEGIFWEFLSDQMGRDSTVIGMTQDYGYRLAYFGWLRPGHWLTSGDFELRQLAGISEEELFIQLAAQLTGYDYFLVTLFNEYERQPELQALLESNYPVFSEGPGYLIFDLRHPLAEGRP